MKKTIFLLAGLFFFFVSFSQTKPYNVILIMTDDQGYGDLSCHGNPIIETPSLDKLHDESIVFTNFHVNPFCAPTRAALMTGRTSDFAHVRSTINSRNHLDLSETTMAQYFKASGYITALFGKWHLGHNYPYQPIDRGFDYWVGHGDGGTGTSSDYWGNDKMNDTYYRNGKWEKFEGFGNDIYFDECMQFISHNKNQPFFVYLATNIPHAPWNVKKEWRKKYEQKFKEAGLMDKAWLIDFYATINRFDKNLGRLRQFLDDEKLSENTLLIFLTDNGTQGGEQIYNAGMRGKKGSVYEGGHRVPCFVHIPAENNRHEEISAFTAHIDILPTLIDLCGLQTPANIQHQPQGRSWLKLIENQATDWPDRPYILHSQNGMQQHTKWKNSLVAFGKWRLINQTELYDIISDPGQKTNVAAQFPDVVQQLQNQYEKNWEEIGEGKSEYARPLIGSGEIKETWLTCDGWVPNSLRPSTWDQIHVNQGNLNFGFWPISVAQQGKYRFEVRRWPKEIDCPVSGSPEPQTVADIFHNGEPVLLPKGTKIDAVKVRLKVGDQILEKEISNQDSYAGFNLDLHEGPTTVQAWLIDASGNEYPGYYVYINE